jgi:hypothetical protein
MRVCADLVAPPPAHADQISRVAWSPQSESVVASVAKVGTVMGHG